MPEERAQRRLAAILAADVVGYSRLMQLDEAGTLATLKARRLEVFQPVVAKHHGRIVKLMGDGALVEFGSAVDAVECAVRLQDAMGNANAGLPEDRQIVLRIGVNLGDVLVEGGDLYGDGVNVAARLEALAEPGSVYVSQTVCSHVRGKAALRFDDMGEQALKNISEPVKVYRVVSATMPAAEAISSAAVPISKPSIAVLPFTNMSGDLEQQYFSDGITEDIITALSRFPELSVIARHSSFQYQDKSVDVRRIGRELAVQYVVEGSLRKIGDRVRITVQLVEAASGMHRWAEHYDRDLKDIFTILDEVTQTIVATLFGRLIAISGSKASSSPTAQWNAYDLLLQARESMSRFDLATAERVTQRAIELDPKFALAVAMQARIHLARYFDDCREETLNEAFAYAQKALSLDENDGFCQNVIGSVYLFMRRFDLATNYLERAVTLNPNNIRFVSWRALGLARTGQSQEALELLDIVSQRDPFRHPAYWTNRAIPLLQQRRYEEVVQTLNHISQKPLWVRAYFAIALAHLDRAQEARAEIAEILSLQPDFSIARFSQGDPWKNPADLEHLLDGLRKAGLPE